MKHGVPVAVFLAPKDEWLWGHEVRPAHKDSGHPSTGSLKDMSLLSSDRVSALGAKTDSLCFSFLKTVDTIAPNLS